MKQVGVRTAQVRDAHGRVWEVEPHEVALRVDESHGRSRSDGRAVFGAYTPGGTLLRVPEPRYWREGVTYDGTLEDGGYAPRSARSDFVDRGIVQDAAMRRGARTIVYAGR